MNENTLRPCLTWHGLDSLVTFAQVSLVWCCSGMDGLVWFGMNGLAGPWSTRLIISQHICHFALGYSPGQHDLMWFCLLLCALVWHGIYFWDSLWSGTNGLVGEPWSKINYFPTCYLPSCIRTPLQVIWKVQPAQHIKRNQATTGCKTVLKTSHIYIVQQ